MHSLLDDGTQWLRGWRPNPVDHCADGRNTLPVLLSQKVPWGTSAPAVSPCHQCWATSRPTLTQAGEQWVYHHLPMLQPFQVVREGIEGGGTSGNPCRQIPTFMLGCVAQNRNPHFCAGKIADAGVSRPITWPCPYRAGRGWTSPSPRASCSCLTTVGYNDSHLAGWLGSSGLVAHHELGLLMVWRLPLLWTQVIFGKSLWLNFTPPHLQSGNKNAASQLKVVNSLLETAILSKTTFIETNVTVGQSIYVHFLQHISGHKYITKLLNEDPILNIDINMSFPGEKLDKTTGEMGTWGKHANSTQTVAPAGKWAFFLNNFIIKQLGTKCL